MYDISALTTVEDLERLRPEWVALFDRSRIPNPFVHPDWLITWAQHFANPSDLHVLAVRSGSELVGVAPFFRRSFSLLGLRTTFLRMLGSGRNSVLTEMPQVLTAPDQSRHVLRAVVGHLCAHARQWDWIEIELGITQGWFEREWIPLQGAGAGSVALHKRSRAFVVLPLPPTWDELRRNLKRNVKESLRRGTNRLKHDAHKWRVVEPDGSEASLERSLGTLVALHKARAHQTGIEPHANYFESAREEAFLYEVGRRMRQSGSFTPLILEVDGERSPRGYSSKPATRSFSRSPARARRGGGTASARRCSRAHYNARSKAARRRRTSRTGPTSRSCAGASSSSTRSRS